MSNFLQYSESAINASKSLSSSSIPWWSQSLESKSCIKENLSPVLENSSDPFLPSISTKPLHLNTIVTNSISPLKIGTGASKRPLVSKIEEEEEVDLEIEVIENVISHLSSRLEALRLQKAQKQKQSVLKSNRKRENAKIDDLLVSSEKSKVNNRRGISFGPAEIVSGAKTRFLSKHEKTPASAKSRRLSCYWKLGEIDELRIRKERVKNAIISASVSQRKRVSKSHRFQKQSVGSKRPIKKDGEKSSKKQSRRAGRIGASEATEESEPLSPPSVSAMVDALPKIRNSTNVVETRRGVERGAGEYFYYMVKRVADLVASVDQYLLVGK